MTRSDFEKKYWNYYIHLEQRFMDIEPYVYFDRTNFSVYSYEFVSQLQAIGAETDVLLKVLCGYPGDKNKNMYHYRQDILPSYPNIAEQSVDVRYFNLSLTPFSNLDTGLEWWQNYNAIKHDRQNNMTKANLETVLTALAGLFLLNRHLLGEEVGEEEHHFIKDSGLFGITGVDCQPNMKFVTRSDGGMSLLVAGQNE